MPFINIKQKKDLINLKKTLVKKAKEENLENIVYDTNLEKVYKPIIEPLEKIAKETKETKNSIEGIRNIPAILPPEKQSNLLALESKLPSSFNLGPLAHKYISKIFSKSKEFDNTYGLKYDPDDMTFQLGDKTVEIEGNNIIIGNYEYQLNENI